MRTEGGGGVAWGDVYAVIVYNICIIKNCYYILIIILKILILTDVSSLLLRLGF